MPSLYAVGFSFNEVHSLFPPNHCQWKINDFHKSQSERTRADSQNVLVPDQTVDGKSWTGFQMNIRFIGALLYGAFTPVSFSLCWVALELVFGAVRLGRWESRNHKSRPNKRTEFFLKRWSHSNEPWSGSAVCGEQCWGGERITSNASYVIILLFQVTSKLTHYFLIYRKISEKILFSIYWLMRRVNMILL